MERKVADAHDEIFRDPVKAVVERTRFLNGAGRDVFTREWMLRALSAELHRYSMEDDYIDMSSAPVEAAQKALVALEDGDEWIHPKLIRYLLACRDVAKMTGLSMRKDETKFVSEGREWPVLSNVAESEAPFAVSSTTARSVPIIESNLANPRYCIGIISGFADKVDILKRECGIDHLAFIEKEIGPVGAISLMSSLVKDSGLPACIYRETHWAQRAAIVGVMPKRESKVAILYDLIVTGTGICNAADVIKEISGARSIAAVVLCGYGLRRDELKTEQGQKIRVESLMWAQSPEGLEADAARGKSKAQNDSVSRDKPREERALDIKSRANSRAVSPGYYSPETLPPLSPKANAIVERVRAGAAQYKDLGTLKANKIPSEVSVRGIRLSNQKGSGIRIK